MANLNNLLTAENPLSGEKHSVLDVGAWWNMILGVFMFLFVVSFGQRVAGWFSNRVPAAGTAGGNLFGVPGPVVESGPSFVDYGAY